MSNLTKQLAAIQADLDDLITYGPEVNSAESRAAAERLVAEQLARIWREIATEVAE